jgi:hypothetical protein
VGRGAVFPVAPGTQSPKVRKRPKPARGDITYHWQLAIPRTTPHATHGAYINIILLIYAHVICAVIQIQIQTQAHAHSFTMHRVHLS